MAELWNGSDVNETNAELEEMNTVEARDEAYERTRETMPIDEFTEPYLDYFGADEYDELWI